MTIDIKRFHQLFFEEAAEHLATMESLLLGMDIDAPDPQQLNAVFRAAHSIKGSAGTFGFTDLAQITHGFENLLDRLRKGTMALRHEMVDVFLATLDVLKSMLSAHQGGGHVGSEVLERTCQNLEELLSQGDGMDLRPQDDGLGGESPESGHLMPDDPDGGYGFFLPETSAEAAADGEEDAYGFFVDPVNFQAAAPEDAADSLASNAGSAFLDAGNLPEQVSTTMRVRTEQVDQVINLLGELVITQSSLAQAASALDPFVYEQLHRGLAHLERNTRDLQSSILAMRMVPVSTVFSRFPRVVRELSKMLGKQVQLKIIGEGTELDKGLVERLVDPLTHLVRNCMDHGIESPEVRVVAGKSATGIVTLKASHQAGNIVIEVSDDGAGLNRQRISSRARELGLPVQEQMSDHEVWQLIFEPGFSTADQLTEVSGRGVGMDVVRRNIAELGGRMDIESMTGVGTRMILRLPLTLAILDGISVAVGDETFVIPTGAVVESLQVPMTMIKSLSGASRLLDWRAEYLPIMILHQAFCIPSALSTLDQGIMVVLEMDGRRAALFVDTLIGQQQFVIKSLEANYRRVPAVAGATIMGNGRVGLILDVGALVGMAHSALPPTA